MKTILKFTLAFLTILTIAQTSFSRNVEIVTTDLFSQTVINDNDLLTPPPPPPTCTTTTAIVVQHNGGVCVCSAAGDFYMPNNLQGKLQSGQVVVGDTVTIKITVPPGGGGGGGMGQVSVVILGGK
ncbi:MAG: hypothetical protein H6581_01360 [Bacteroidia bacterium]|nr:hypothetical protein [Bacteroidia bacterium]